LKRTKVAKFDPDQNGFPNVDATSAAIARARMHAFHLSLGILRICSNEAPEFCQPGGGTRRPAWPKPQKA
jgi:hypothetical protein